MNCLYRLTGAIAVLSFAVGVSSAAPDSSSPQKYSSSALGSPTIAGPISVYDDWSVYDELSDNVPLTEKLAMQELDNVLRLKKLGAHFDYYVMDAFWFDPDGAYRKWKNRIGRMVRMHGSKNARKITSVPACGSARIRW